MYIYTHTKPFDIVQSLGNMVRAVTNITLCLVLLLSFTHHHVRADHQMGPNYPALDDETYQPSLGVVIGILGIMFVITLVILIYAKMCRDSNNRTVIRTTVDRTGLGGFGVNLSRRFSGIDKTVVESLPFFRFSSLKGSREGLECSVCLSRFEDVEILRMLPKCAHAFHVACIDRWLEKHSSCPLCRQKICSDDLRLVAYSDSLRFLGLREDSMIVSITREDRDHNKHNHRIVVSGLGFNNRWSDLRSSDLLSLSSEMTKEDSSLSGSRMIGGGDRRSASEITAVSRESKIGINEGISSSSRLDEREERVRKIWLPIANRTVQMFANKDTSLLPLHTENKQ